MVKTLRFTLLTVLLTLAAASSASAAVFTSNTPFSGSANSGNVNLPFGGSPAQLAVSGLNGTVTDVNVLLNANDASNWSYFDWMLMSPSGVGVMLLSDCGWYHTFSNFSIFLDQSAPNAAASGQEFVTTSGTTGSFRPTDCYDSESFNGDDFPGVLPSADLTPDLNRFNGASPNGTWQLFAGGSGSTNYQAISISGWSLEVTTAAVPPDAKAPVITRPSVSGRTLGYTLDEAATLKFLVDRASTGVKTKSKKCVKKTKSRKGKSCTRYSPLPGSITTLGTAGVGTFAFNGRLAGKKLAPGKYRFTMTATDAAGNVSAPVTYKVTIKKPKKKR